MVGYAHLASGGIDKQFGCEAHAVNSFFSAIQRSFHNQGVANGSDRGTFGAAQLGGERNGVTVCLQRCDDTHHHHVFAAGHEVTAYEVNASFGEVRGAECLLQVEVTFVGFVTAIVCGVAIGYVEVAQHLVAAVGTAFLGLNGHEVLVHHLLRFFVFTLKKQLLNGG